jgi:hypothetical protein
MTDHDRRSVPDHLGEIIGVGRDVEWPTDIP